MDLAAMTTQFYWLAIYGFVLYAVSELTVRSKWGTLIVIFFPFLVLPMLADTTFNGWFNTTKFFTLIFVALYGTLVRFKLSKKWALIILAFTFHINIIEAVLRDFQSGYYLNTISGIILMLMVCLPSKMYVQPAKDGLPSQVVFPMGWPAIIVYVAWHMCFIYGYESIRGFRGDYLLMNVVMHAIPLLIAYMYSSKIWLQTRLYTLAFQSVLVEATLTRSPEVWPLTPNVYDPVVYNIFAAVVLLINCACVVYMLRKQPEKFAASALGFFFRKKGAVQKSPQM